MDGLLLVDKPLGISSYDVIRHIKNLFIQANRPVPKIGHAGTLDPLATGLLIILLGKATKTQSQFMKQSKIYEAEITLGVYSSTDDAEGELTPPTRPPAQAISLDEVKDALKQFMGEIEQMPPQFSALKVKGQRAYRLARQGEVVELKPRTVTVYSLKLCSYRYPKLIIITEVSSGTYIRSLARDIGGRLGSGGYLSKLRRTSIGDFQVTQSISLEKLSLKSIANRLLAV